MPNDRGEIIEGRVPEATPAEDIEPTRRGDAPAKRLIFIGGAEGSGTTLLLRLLSRPQVCASLGGNVVKLSDHVEARPLAQAFEEANRRLWDRKLSFTDHSAARDDWHAVTKKILLSPAFSGQSHIVFKRSFPFALPRDRYTPDIWDVLDLMDDVSVVVIYRDPCSATYSAFRRGFDADLRRLAVACGEQLTWLAAQVRAIGPERVRLVSYRSLCRDPLSALSPIAAHCVLPLGPLEDAIGETDWVPSPDARYANELSHTDVDWLEGYFDARRRLQWDILEATQTMSA